ncbi:hypothetical protein B0J18DRAFT_40536 [Chaetomium sp. MPI-SDFR-AT-0129]|nr:hypothetical protein B0J18DRAFT_40536 [Chaetomium sp. MPI-SDFR-AT-0129]
MEPRSGCRVQPFALPTLPLTRRACRDKKTFQQGGGCTTAVTTRGVRWKVATRRCFVARGTCYTSFPFSSYPTQTTPYSGRLAVCFLLPGAKRTRVSPRFRPTDPSLIRRVLESGPRAPISSLRGGGRGVADRLVKIAVLAVRTSESCWQPKIHSHGTGRVVCGSRKRTPGPEVTRTWCGQTKDLLDGMTRTTRHRLALQGPLTLVETVSRFATKKISILTGTPFA